MTMSTYQEIAERYLNGEIESDYSVELPEWGFIYHPDERDIIEKIPAVRVRLSEVNNFSCPHIKTLEVDYQDRSYEVITLIDTHEPGWQKKLHQFRTIYLGRNYWDNH